MDELLATAAAQCTAVMCAEAVWWRCHRRMIADFVTLARNVPVLHLHYDGRQEPHRPSDLARLRTDGLIVYDAGNTLPPCR